MTKSIQLVVPQTYAALRRAVADALLAGQRRVEEAKLRTYWETGWFIKEHILFNGDRAEHGKKVMRDLSRDLKADRRTLYECLKFARVFPIVSGRSQLSWSYYRKFIQVPDAGQRKALMAETIARGWTSDDVAERVVLLNASRATAANAAGAVHNSAASEARRLVPNRGAFEVHRVTTVEGSRVVDLGFACYLDLTEEQAERFRDGDLVRVDAAGKISVAEGATKADLFNYRAEILKIVDGDTLWVKVYLRPAQWMKQKLRLRGLDCLESKTPEGKAAKRFVEGLLAGAGSVAIHTTKPDKYDRYLADVFVRPPRAGSSAPDETEIFLNNALLENGHAGRKDAWEFGDWGLD